MGIEGRGRGQGRGRKRRAESEYGNTISIHHQPSEDYPFSPPLSLRGVAFLTTPPYSHFGSHEIKTSTHSSTLRPTLIINLDKDDRSPDTSQHGKEKEVDEGSMELISETPAGPEEIGSSSLECVDGHRVKTQYAPLLRAIFNKYGDITRGTDVKSPYRVSIFLERLCYVYQRLERAKLVDLTRAELQGMSSELRLLERRKVRVGWILERVEYISKMKDTFFQDCQREASIERKEKDLEEYEKRVCLLEQKISSTKQKLLMHKAKK